MNFPPLGIHHSSFIISSIPWWRHLPVVNAALNGTSAVLLLIAFLMIKQRKYTAHATFVICAFVTSAVFLALYLLEHWIKYQHNEAITRYRGSYPMTYFAILISHTILAVMILPLILGSFSLAYKRQWKLHHKVSSFTFPLWLYVSVTGVVVYWMLYRLAPTLPR